MDNIPCLNRTDRYNFARIRRLTHAGYENISGIAALAWLFVTSTSGDMILKRTDPVDMDANEIASMKRKVIVRNNARTRHKEYTGGKVIIEI